MTCLALVTHTMLHPSALTSRTPSEWPLKWFCPLYHCAPWPVQMWLLCSTSCAPPYPSKWAGRYSHLALPASASFSQTLTEDLCSWMILTKYSKVFLFFWLLLFLTKALISIFHILCLPIDTPNAVEATLEILLSRTKCKKQMSGHVIEKWALFPCSCWQGHQHLQIKQYFRQEQHL